MVLFVHRATHIRVMRLRGTNFAEADNCGKIFRTMKGASRGVTGRAEWIWDGCYRSQHGYETFTDFEKRQIIGLLDNLNGVLNRAQEGYLTRWREIIGLSPADVI